jgi:thiamine biosynthesis lipoprotein
MRGERIRPFDAVVRLRVAAVLVALLSGCGGSHDAGAAAQATPPVEKSTPAPTASPVNPPPPPAAVPPPSEAPQVIVRRTRELMGTIIQMTVLDVPEERAGPILDQAMAEMSRLEGVLSEWRDDSEISRINQAAGLHPVRVSEDTLANVRVGLQVARWSDGAFDLSWAALRGLYLFQPGKERVPTDAELAARLAFVNYKDIVLDEAAHTVFLRRKGMLLGTGGIAKGYALEKASDILVRGGLQNFMFFGGGQVVVHGKRGNRGWRVGVQHPRMDDYFGFVEAERGSISTSGDYEHFFIRDGVRWHHIIDLKTGRPVTHTAAVTVVSDSPFYADAIDTALFIMGPDKALQKLASAPGPKADALIVGSDMRLYSSPGMQQRLILRAELKDGRLPLAASGN